VGSGLIQEIADDLLSLDGAQLTSSLATQIITEICHEDNFKKSTRCLMSNIMKSSSDQKILIGGDTAQSALGIDLIGLKLAGIGTVSGEGLNFVLITVQIPLRRGLYFLYLGKGVKSLFKTLEFSKCRFELSYPSLGWVETRATSRAGLSFFEQPSSDQL